MSRPERIALGALLLCSLAAYFAYGARPVAGLSLAVSGDAHYVFLTARSLAFDLDLDLTNQYARFSDPFGLGAFPAADGWRFPPREIGPALLMVPGLWLHAAIGLGPQWAPMLACLPAATSLALLAWVSFRIVDVVLEKASRSGDAVPRGIQRGLLVGGPALGFVVPFYTVGAAGYAHAPDAVVCSVLVLGFLNGRAAPKQGLWLALALLLRLQNALWLAWPAALIVLQSDGSRRERWRYLMIVAIVATLGVIPQVYLTLAHPGSDTGAIRWTRAFFDLDDYVLDVLRILFSRHGLLIATPWVMIAVGGLSYGLWATQRRAVSSVLWAGALVVALQLALIGMTRDPLGGWTFGARRFAGCTPIFAMGAAIGWVHFRRAALEGWRTYAYDFAVALTLVGNLVVTWLAVAGQIELDTGT